VKTDTVHEMCSVIHPLYCEAVYTANSFPVELFILQIHFLWNYLYCRFISCGTVEEKIYRRQIFKDSVNRQTMQKDEKNVFRYHTLLEYT